MPHRRPVGVGLVVLMLLLQGPLALLAATPATLAGHDPGPAPMASHHPAAQGPAHEPASQPVHHLHPAGHHDPAVCDESPAGAPAECSGTAACALACPGTAGAALPAGPGSGAGAPRIGVKSSPPVPRPAELPVPPLRPPILPVA